MSIFRCELFSACLAAMVLCVGGCVFSSSSYTRTLSCIPPDEVSEGVVLASSVSENTKEMSSFEVLSLQERLMAYLYDRYPCETFAFVDSLPKGTSGVYLRASCEAYPVADIMVSYDIVDGVEFISDNFLYFVYASQTEPLLERIVGDVFDCSFRLFLNIPSVVGVTSLSGDATFAEFISDEATVLDFAVVLPSGYVVADKGALERQLVDACDSYGVSVSCAVFYFPDFSFDFGLAESVSMLSDIPFSATPTTLTVLGLGTVDALFTWR